MRRLLVFVAACCASAPPIGPASRPIERAPTLGETFTIESKILGEQRVINVYLPPDHDKGATFPVLYMPDGGIKEDFPHVVGSVDVSIKNGVIRPVIVVGVENTERRRDLPGPTTVPDEQKAAPHAGGNDKFRRFLRDELKPQIAARYHVTAESALIGESLAGLFVIETLIVEPTLFDSYIAADPSVWWNEQALMREVHRLGWLAAPKQLYVATSGDDPGGIEQLFSALRIYGPPVTWKYEPMPHETHGTLFPTAALHGIRMVFAAPPE
jgi:uncharacterized protein